MDMVMPQIKQDELKDGSIVSKKKFLHYVTV